MQPIEVACPQVALFEKGCKHRLTDQLRTGWQQLRPVPKAELDAMTPSSCVP